MYCLDAETRNQGTFDSANDVFFIYKKYDFSKRMIKLPQIFTKVIFNKNKIMFQTDFSITSNETVFVY